MTLSPGPQRDADRTRTAVVMWILLLLFGFRVGAQWVQKYAPVDFLPPFTAWESGLLPYALLLGIQLAMLVVMTAITHRLTRGRINPSRRTGGILLSLGAFYFAFMLFRFGAAFTFARHQPFFGSPVPAFFHLVLSSWLLALGLYHRMRAPAPEGELPARAGPTLVSWLCYPLVMALGVWLHFFLRDIGLGLQLSTYLPLAAGVTAIALLERKFPYRSEWQPDGDDVKGDVTFLVLVQILWPKLLEFFVALTLLGWLHAAGLTVPGVWPHALPPVVQALLMILVADFFRYWLHRASHEWSPLLWRFHAVHHSPHKLYWVNVGRFHPIDKFLQFLLEAAPFMLLGVSGEVLALYYILYAINGFFQHSNIRLHLGPMNYLIAGPELHRWHHSWEARESNSNYGNNIILWDVLFGSYFLPGNREVGLLGLRNRAYPRNFLTQMRTPFIKGADQAEE